VTTAISTGRTFPQATRLPTTGPRVACLLVTLVLTVTGCEEEASLKHDDSDARSGYLTFEGTRVYHEVHGQGPAVILLHAGVADLRMWDPQVEHLSSRFTVICYDMRGFGRTELAPGAFSDHEDVIALMDSLGVDTAILMGSSYGGQVAIDACLSRPDRIRALVLVAPNVGGHYAPPELKAFAEEEGAALKRGDLDGAVELNLRTWVDGPHRGPAEVDSTVRSRVGEMQRNVFEKTFPDGVIPRSLDPPAATRLSEIAAPTLVVVGSLDVAAFVDLAGWVASEIPGARLVTIDDAAHMVSMERPDAFNDTVDGFLTEIAGGR
jgi:pimeloyl-ACP methyl ester carboxylesterase